ncbi:MAG: oxidoreductase [Planctomycetes bacterium SM23_32]|nr:MAG: oxidoreductase [Planctomycetes bacterium SM23_32]
MLREEGGRPQPTARVAVVGIGHWGRNLVRNFHALGALKAVCDADARRESSVREDYPGVEFRADYPALLADDGVEAVVVATPAATHFEVAEAALEADKDVFVEKPLAMSVAEGRHLVELADQRGRTLMVGHILRYHPAVIRLKELIARGSLGRLLYLYSSRLNMGKIRTEENILWSFAPHDISVMLGLLGEEPNWLACQGGNYVSEQVPDVTLSQFTFPSGVRAHIFVSWLHPFKEQRLVVVGTDRMAVFDDTVADKLVLYDYKIEWRNRIPTAVRAGGEPVPVEAVEPLRAECQHFLDCIRSRGRPVTDGHEGLAVLQVLEACQRSLEAQGAPTKLSQTPARKDVPFYVHPTSIVDENCTIGEGSRIWHFSHILSNSTIGRDCRIGQNVVIGPDVHIGNGCKIQNNVSVYTGVTLEDYVFCGPSAVFTNVQNPRSEIARMHQVRPTLVKRGATIGANATIVCGNTIGEYAFVGAGSVVTRHVPAYALVYGNPAMFRGWICRCAAGKLVLDQDSFAVCPECGDHYHLQDGVVQPVAKEL